MKNRYVIEFWLRDEAIDVKESSQPIIVPREGERIHIIMENPNMGEGESYIVLEVRYLMFTSKQNGELQQKIMVDLSPDKDTKWKSDILR